VQFDGIWLSMQTQQDGIHEDSRKRKRHRKSGKRMVVLVALGLWTEGLEQALDYVYGSALLQQRCIFHKLRNVSGKCVGLDRKEKKLLLEQAAAVYQATSAPEAQARLAAFAEHWRPTQPQAVATFEHEFEQTIRYFSLDGIVREVVRSTSRLERTNRELRRKFRQVGCFSSPRGAEVAVYIQVTRLNAQWARTSWWEASHSLALDLLNSNP
jgi:transposase-like protein